MKHLITGASGRVGSAVVTELLAAGEQVRAIVRSPEKAKPLEATGAEIVIADLTDEAAVAAAFKGVDTFFAITPEDPTVEDIPGTVKTMLKNYRKGVRGSLVKTIVGLSSMGADLPSGSGNLLMSNWLERAFRGLAVDQVFIRPGYYYSNWLMSAQAAKDSGELSTFFPTDMKLAMTSPEAVAKLGASLLRRKGAGGLIYELQGPEWYSSRDIAEALSRTTGKKIRAVQMPKSTWPNMLEQAGFSKSGMDNFIEMTDAVIGGKTGPNGLTNMRVKSDITPEQYFAEHAGA